MNFLFLCVANSARSQIAEGLAKDILGSEHNIQSAGSEPSGKVNPLAIEVMNEIDIDISKNSSKSVDDLDKDFRESIDYAITLCAEEVCPIVHSETHKIHWPNPDPAAVNDTKEVELEAFREARDNIKENIVILKKQIK